MANISIKEKSDSPDYYQVTNIRFLSMVTIVAMHTEIFKLSFAGNQLNLIIYQLLKFGTIGFFIISGFLLGHKLIEVHPFDYFKRRLRTIFRPWLFWAGLFSVIALINKGLSGKITFNDVTSQIYYTLFISNYWFVINFLFALGILLLFRKYFQNFWFSCLLLLSSLFYGINLYLGWIPTNHTTAIFGYIFYIWTGIQVSIYRNQVISFLDSVNWFWIITAVLASFFIAYSEAVFLFKRSPDFLSSLRVSNQIYSIVFFFALLKINRPINPSWMNVRQETYGIYLIHWLILDIIKAFASRTGAKFYNVTQVEFLDYGFRYLSSPILILAFWILSFTIVYLTAWFITNIISKSRFSVLVGVSKKN